MNGHEHSGSDQANPAYHPGRSNFQTDGAGSIPVGRSTFQQLRHVIYTRVVLCNDQMLGILFGKPPTPRFTAMWGQYPER